MVDILPACGSRKVWGQPNSWQTPGCVSTVMLSDMPALSVLPLRGPSTRIMPRSVNAHYLPQHRNRHADVACGMSVRDGVANEGPVVVPECCTHAPEALGK